MVDARRVGPLENWKYTDAVHMSRHWRAQRNSFYNDTIWFIVEQLSGKKLFMTETFLKMSAVFEECI
jgi:hypothetical protein